MPKTIRVSPTFTEADKDDREFYKKLSGKERLDILLQLIRHEPEQRLERICRVTQLSDQESWDETRTRRVNCGRPSISKADETSSSLQ
jgi:hypothetical protein